MKTRVRLKRVYDPPSSEDGRRVLVDRLWPRGLSKQKARLDDWLKEVAPSHELRRWFGHDPERWAEFRRRYEEELKGAPALEQLKRMAAEGPLTLLYAARDEAHNEAVVLAEHLRRA
jgi:uncharacterized protein YeaO (DUF488 family)